MIEILFRARDHLGEDGFVYGAAVHKTGHYGKPMDAWFITENDGAFTDMGYRVVVDPSTICQYTGVDDKNGKKIFEKDIVKTKYGRICVVSRFQSPCFNGFDLQPIETEENINAVAPSSYDLWESVNLEIVGNIFDNTELLK